MKAQLLRIANRLRESYRFIPTLMEIGALRRAVIVMGIALADMRLASLRVFLAFKDNMTIILVSSVFALLSASFDLGVLRRFEWRFGLFPVGRSALR